MQNDRYMTSGSAGGNAHRLDKEIERRGLARSRSAAADLIKRGKVRINGKAAAKPSQEISSGDAIEVDGGQFVSRAGEKLAFALDAWKIDVSGMTALDVGASTGGFTDCLLQRGVARVVAVDVGTDQLDHNLKADPRVESHEKTDIRDLAKHPTKITSHSPIDLAVCDVSFISLELILPSVHDLIKKRGTTIALVKPQFEVGKEVADRFKGIIYDDQVRRAALERVKASIKELGFSIKGQIDSPIEGEKGNREYLLLLEK